MWAKCGSSSFSASNCWWVFQYLGNWKRTRQDDVESQEKPMISLTWMERWWVTENSTGRSKMICMVTTHVLGRLPHVDGEMFSNAAGRWWKSSWACFYRSRFTWHPTMMSLWWARKRGLEKLGKPWQDWVGPRRWGKGTHVTPSEIFFFSASVRSGPLDFMVWACLKTVYL